MEIYVVQSGDSIDRIARNFTVDVNEIIWINQLIYPYALAVGQALLIPTAGRNERSPLLVGGYAYPFIQDNILEETLGYLSELYIFSYGFTMEGDLLPPQISEDRMLAKAEQVGVGSVLTLTPFGLDGKFNNQLIHSLVTDSNVKNHLIQQLIQVMQEKGYSGVDVDFEYILAEDRDLFTGFVAELTEIMNARDWRVSVALAPKTSAAQKGLLYEGKDYGGLGSVANQVLLMAYEWGYTYGPNMAVAPINKVREVVEYAVSEIPVNKINLGIPNYGYDWALPYERGVTKARTIGNIEAVELAVRYGVPIRFDEVAQSPYFRYIAEGVEHEVWFEDVRSMRETFDLVREFSLEGVAYWQIMRLFRANWYLLQSEFEILSVV